MLKLFKIFFKVAVGCAAVIGSVQATPLTPIATYSGNTAWQDINGASYTFADANHNSQVDVGETITFTVDMHKQWWGTHAFDALKVWIDGSPINPPSSTLYTDHFAWDYDPTHVNQQFFNKPGDTYSHRPWTGGDKLFSFDYTPTTAGSFYLTASVMCSRDLSGLSGTSNDKPTRADWNAWKEDVHQKAPWLQGETERYQFTVSQPVPEPETYGMLMAGLGLVGAVVRRRKAKQ